MATYNRSESFVDTVADTYKELQDFKGVQYSGDDIYTNHTYQLTPNGVYDFSVDGLFQTGALFKFTADKQKNPYSMLFIKYYSNSSLTNPVSPNTLDGGPFLDVQGSTNGVIRYEYLVWNENNFRVYGKVFIIATDTGVFSYDTI